MSSDDELPHPSQRAPRSKKTAPATPDESKSDPNDAEEVEKTVNRGNARPRIMWVRKLTITKARWMVMKQKRKLLLEPVHKCTGINRALHCYWSPCINARESIGLYKVATDCGLWTLVRDWWCDGGKTRVFFTQVPSFQSIRL